MKKELDNFISAMNWLAMEGRAAAQEIWAYEQTKPEDERLDWDEIAAWINDLADGVEP